MKSIREKALELALLRVCEEAPKQDGWPPFNVAVSDALHLLTGRIAPSDYLKAKPAA